MKAAQKADGIVTDFVFAQGKKDQRLTAHIGKPMNDNKERLYLGRLVDPEEASLHGMRVTFSSWAYSQKGIDTQDIERALGHIAGYGENYVARIYNRDAVRDNPMRQLMEAWASFCDGKTGDVIQLFPQVKQTGEASNA
jgi:hypothetical protein